MIAANDKSASAQPGSAATGAGVGRPSPRPRPPVSGAKFLVWFALAFLGSFFVVWLYVEAAPLAYLDRDYPYLLAKQRLQAECRAGDVAVFGDSRAVAAVIPSLVGVPTTNYAMSGTSPVETYFAVKRLLACPTAPKLILLAHSPLKYSSDSDYWTFDARTGFLSYGEMRAVETEARRLHDDQLERERSGDHLPGALRDFLFRVGFPPFYFDSLLNAIVAARLGTNQAALRDNIASGGYGQFGTAPGSSKPATEAGAGFSRSPLIDAYLSRTLRLAAKRGVPVYAVSVPINDATCAQMPKSLRDDFRAYLDAKAAVYPGLRVVDPVLPCWDNSFFGDAWHLNAKGARLYSQALGGWLRNIYGGVSSAVIDTRGGFGTIRSTPVGLYPAAVVADPQMDTAPGSIGQRDDITSGSRRVIVRE